MHAAKATIRTFRIFKLPNAAAAPAAIKMGAAGIGNPTDSRNRFEKMSR
jgi:hypothetical protein